MLSNNLYVLLLDNHVATCISYLIETQITFSLSEGMPETVAPSGGCDKDRPQPDQQKCYAYSDQKEQHQGRYQDGMFQHAASVFLSINMTAVHSKITAFMTLY